MESKSMVEVLAYHAGQKPGQLFAADNAGNEFTYADAWRSVRKMAAFLMNNAALKLGDRLMAECNQDVPFLLLNFACELSGIVFIPIEESASLDRKKAICEETGSTLWVFKNTPLPFVESLHYDEIFLYDEIFSCEEMLSEEMLSYEENWPEVEFPKGDVLAEILYTTGTTGSSKGIMISNQANVALAENIMYGVQMKPCSTELIPVPVSHSHGLRCCYANLLNGGTIVLTDGLLRVKDVFALMDRYAVTAMDLSPSAAMMLIRLSKGAFWHYGKRMDYIQIGTAALPEGLKQQLLDGLPGVRLYNFYGSTESGRSCVLDFSKDMGKWNCIGKPTKNAEIVFTDEKRKIIRSDSNHPGLLAARGSMNMTGYWKQEKLTMEFLRDNYVYTNDLGYMDEEGYAYVLGRKDDVIICNGIKISPEEIEEIAIKYESVQDAACVPIPDSTAGQISKLFIVVRELEKFDMKAYNRFLVDHLDGNKLPKQVEIIDTIPRTFNGKIQRQKLI